MNDQPTQEKVAIRFVKAWTEYKRNDETGEIRQDDWLEYCAPMKAQSATTVDAVRRLKRDPARWAALGPAYNAWKTNSELPTDGVPLAAWPGVTPQQAEILRSHSLRTVEDVAAISDDFLRRVALPNMRGLKEQAGRFLAAQGGVKVELELKKKDDQIAALEAKLDELAEMVAAREDNEPKRGPGRPRKPEQAAAE